MNVSSSDEERIKNNKTMKKIKIEIKSIYGNVLFSWESENNTQRETILEAIRQNADLRSADLSSADLSYANLSSADLSSAAIIILHLRQQLM